MNSAKTEIVSNLLPNQAARFRFDYHFYSLDLVTVHVLLLYFIFLRVFFHGGRIVLSSCIDTHPCPAVSHSTLHPSLLSILDNSQLVPAHKHSNLTAIHTKHFWPLKRY